MKGKKLRPEDVPNLRPTQELLAEIRAAGGMWSVVLRVNVTTDKPGGDYYLSGQGCVDQKEAVARAMRNAARDGHTVGGVATSQWHPAPKEVL
jgi:hypothetical protein